MDDTGFLGAMDFRNQEAVILRGELNAAQKKVRALLLKCREMEAILQESHKNSFRIHALLIQQLGGSATFTVADFVDFDNNTQIVQEVDPATNNLILRVVAPKSDTEH